MQIMPELAVALRRELSEALKERESEVIALSTWAKVRNARAGAYVATLRSALEQTMPIVLWQRGEWAAATTARVVIGGELTTEEDIERDGQLWLFDTISIPATVKKRFCLTEDARALGRILLPLSSSPATELSPQQGIAMGYLFRMSPQGKQRDGVPFLRFLPDLYRGEFIADPHVNFVAAYRYAKKHRYPIPAPEKGRVFMVGRPN